MKNNPNGLIYALMLMILVYVARIQELFSFLMPMQLGKISIFLALLLFFFSKKSQLYLPPWKIPQAKMVLAILGLCVISVPFSVWPGHSFSVAIEGFPRTVLFFFLLIYAVNNFSDLHKLIWAFIVGGILLAFFTITPDGSGRMSASHTYDPNDIAMLFVVTLPIVYFFMSSIKGLAKIILFGTLMILLFAFILTVSRGGFIGLMVITLLILFKDKYRSWMVKMVVMALLVMAFVQFAPDTYWDRIKTIMTYEEDYNMTAEHGRKQLWLSGLGLMFENPITGVGAGAFMFGLGHSLGDEGGKWLTAHNAFIQIGAELGIGGLILFVSLILTSFLSLKRLQLKYKNIPGEFHDHLWLITALEVSLWGYVSTAMFLSAAYFAMFYFLIALCCILRKLDVIYNKQKAETQFAVPSRQEILRT